MKHLGRSLALSAIGLAVLAAVVPPPTRSRGVSAAVGGFLFGRPRTRSIGDAVFEVTARGNNARERRSSLEMALIKAARRAERENGGFLAILRERSGTWRMGGRSIGDETTLRFRVLPAIAEVRDESGRPARIYRVADLLSGTVTQIN